MRTRWLLWATPLGDTGGVVLPRVHPNGRRPNAPHDREQHEHVQQASETASMENKWRQFSLFMGNIYNFILSVTSERMNAKCVKD